MLRKLYRQVRRPPARQDVAAALERIATLVRAGDAALARVQLQSYLERYPDDSEALHLRGLLEMGAGRLEAAVLDLDLACRIDPEDRVFRANLGLALWRLGRLTEAREHLETALGDGVGVAATAALNLAGVLGALGEPGAAAARLARVLEQAPQGSPGEVAALWLTLAGLEAVVPDIDAPACIERARLLDPGSKVIPLLLYMPMAQRCDWRYPDAALAQHFERHAGDEAGAADEPVLAPALADCLPVSRRARLVAARRYGNMIQARVRSFARPRVAAVARESAPRIRIGYLSADFHNHPTLQLLRGVLAAHDHSRFEIHAYSIGPDDGSELRREAQGRFARFNDIRLEAPRDTARRIEADGIDVLVDLKGYTGGGRPEILALRPAPVQVNYLGHPGTMGVDWVDYLIADPVIVPHGADVWYSEKIVYLPHCYQPNDNAQTAARDCPGRADAWLPADGFVFCCFNSPYKIEARIFSVWMEILTAVPRSVLWLLCDRDDARENLRGQARARGVAAERLVFAPSLPKAAHLARLPLADLFLDTHYVNAHTTASDALWAGLPLITCPGDSFSSRVAASIVTAAGLPELVCGSLAAYRDLAVALARDPGRAGALRKRAAAARHASPLFDTRTYTRQLEDAFATIHAISRAGAAPASFCVRRASAHGRA